MYLVRQIVRYVRPVDIFDRNFIDRAAFPGLQEQRLS